MIKTLITLSVFFIFCIKANAQVSIAPLDHNIQSYRQASEKKLVLKTTANTLPFFEDFTDDDLFPDAAKWIGNTVYVNNTMGVNVISRGVVTFDALNAKGGPYDSSNAFALLYADSLTSQPFDLSGYNPGDSLYLSFFYQPQGNGFEPETQDSLMLYLKTNNGWKQVWRKEGTALHPFTQVMIPVADAGYFHSDFQFRFINKASINVSDDVWNIDYIRFNANRSINDTTVDDIAATAPPTGILLDYTSMPYRHFTANISGEALTQHSFNVRNNTNGNQSLTTGYNARETLTNTPLFSGTASFNTIAPYAQQIYQYPLYNISFSAGAYDKVIFENKYYASRGSAEPKANDTIIQNQVFDNYLAYDDGTAEKSIFLKQFTTLPAKMAVEYHLNQPDTLRGVAIYFGRQVPLASGKFFTLQIYKDIEINGGNDDLLYEEQLLFPSYADTINKFWVYKLETPLALSTGIFYVSIMQPASSGSDSLYYGLDVNRTGSNHAYYNVLNVWENVLENGAVMIRPVLGTDIIGTPVNELVKEWDDWTVFPNPVTDKLHIETRNFKPGEFEITDVQGRKLFQGLLSEQQPIPVSLLAPGLYFIRIFNDKQYGVSKKFIKQ